MDSRTRILVAIGASVGARCEPCLRFHMEHGHRENLDPAELDEAIRIARGVGRGADAHLDRIVRSLGEPATDGEPEGTATPCAGRAMPFRGRCCG